MLAVKNPVLTINAAKVVGSVTGTPVSNDPSPINLPNKFPDEIEETNNCWVENVTKRPCPPTSSVIVLKTLLTLMPIVL